MIRFLLYAAVLVCLWLVGSPGSLAQPGGIGSEQAVERQHIRILRHTVDQTLDRKCIANPFRPYQWATADIPAPLLRSVRRTWQARERWALERRSLCGQIRHRELWLCIHRREGRWTDPNPPYFGGLQMGYWFMGAYGDRDTYGRNIYRAEGTANHWTPREQMGVAEAAYREENYSSGWLRGQWPNTAPPCMEQSA